MKREKWTSDRLKIIEKQHRKNNYLLRGTLPCGKRIQLRFVTKREAQLEKDKILINIGNTIERYTALTLDQENEYLEALAAIKNSRLPDSFTIHDAIEFSKNHWKEDELTTLTLKEATDEWITSIKRGKRSLKYIKRNEMYAKKLIDCFGGDTKVGTIRTKDIAAFLDTSNEGIGPWKNVEITPTTQRNNKVAMSMFFTFCKDSKFILDNPVSKTIKTPEVIDRPKTILKHQEIIDIFNVCRDKNIKPEYTIPYFALTIFAGLRPQELCHPDSKRLIEWTDFTFRKDGKPSVVEKIQQCGKTKERRIVQIPENCLNWIRPYVKEEGPVIPISHEEFRVYFDAVRIYAGWKCNSGKCGPFYPETNKINKQNTKSWVIDICRHTALTYYYEKVEKNKHIAAEWAGNDPSVYEEHYNHKIKGTLDKTEEEIVADFYAIEPGPVLAA